MTTTTTGPLFRHERIMWLLIAIVGGFLVAALLSVLFMQDAVPRLSAASYRMDNTPEVVIHNAYIAYSLGDSDMLKTLYTPAAWQELEESINYGYRSTPGQELINGLRVGKPEISQDLAKVRVTRFESYPRGFLGIRSVTWTEMEVTLVREDEEWKLVEQLPYTW